MKGAPTRDVVVKMLRHSDVPLRPRDIAPLIGRSSGAVSQALLKAEKLGLAERAPKRGYWQTFPRGPMADEGEGWITDLHAMHEVKAGVPLSNGNGASSLRKRIATDDKIAAALTALYGDKIEWHNVVQLVRLMSEAAV